MAKKGKKSRRAKLHRTCGAMAAHMMLLERFPSYRANQMRLEDATDRRRQTRFNLRQAKVVTIKTVVNVVYKTAEQNVSKAQIDSQIKALNKDFRATNPDRSQTPAAWTGLVTDSRIQFKVVKITRTKTTEDDFTSRRCGQGQGDGRDRAVQSQNASQPLGLSVARQPARLRPVSWRSAEH